MLTNSDHVSVAYGGNDKITLGKGNDYIMGGVGADTISAATAPTWPRAMTAPSPSRPQAAVHRHHQPQLRRRRQHHPRQRPRHRPRRHRRRHIKIGNGDNIVVGDNGKVIFSAPGILQTIASSDPTDGGDDTITLGAGSNFIIGGVGYNTITAGDGRDVVIGQDGEFDFYGPTTTVGSQAWLSQGRNMTTGYIWNEYQGWYNETFTGGLLTYATSLDPDYGNGSAITLGNGTDLVIGGTGDDTITVGNGSDIVIGNNGNVTFTTWAC